MGRAADAKKREGGHPPRNVSMKKRAVASIGFAIIVVAILGLAAVEINHRLRYGHFVGYGIHADVVERSGDIGIPGIKTFYALQLSNYTFTPLTLVGWKRISDSLGAAPGFGCRFQLQKLSPENMHWSVVADFKPSGAIQFHIVIKKLYPLGSIVPVEHMPTDMDGLRIGDIVRFAVFTNFNAPAANIYTQPFRVEEVRTAGASPRPTTRLRIGSAIAIGQARPQPLMPRGIGFSKGI